MSILLEVAKQQILGAEEALRTARCGRSVLETVRSNCCKDARTDMIAEECDQICHDVRAAATLIAS